MMSCLKVPHRLPEGKQRGHDTAPVAMQQRALSAMGMLFETSCILLSLCPTLEHNSNYVGANIGQLPLKV
jgi:hypothetical protein